MINEYVTRNVFLRVFLAHVPRIIRIFLNRPIVYRTSYAIVRWISCGLIELSPPMSQFAGRFAVTDEYFAARQLYARIIRTSKTLWLRRAGFRCSDSE